MSNQRYTPEFKDEAVRQIIDRGYSVAEVSERIGVSPHSLYKWVKAIQAMRKLNDLSALGKPNN
jgi:transposase